MSELCSQCNERPAVTTAHHWHSIFAFFLLGSTGASGLYCKDCAGGRTFLALLFAGCFLLVTFVLVVIFW